MKAQALTDLGYYIHSSGWREREADTLTSQPNVRTDAGVKTLKTLLQDPDPKISALTGQAIHQAYTSRDDTRGRPLQLNDFDAKFQEPGEMPAEPVPQNGSQGLR